MPWRLEAVSCGSQARESARSEAWAFDEAGAQGSMVNTLENSCPNYLSVPRVEWLA
jgi:hypothetical protein